MEDKFLVVFRNPLAVEFKFFPLETEIGSYDGSCGDAADLFEFREDPELIEPPEASQVKEGCPETAA
jgi:hypothetical protein